MPAPTINEVRFGRAIQKLSFNDFSGGLRENCEPHKIRDNEVWFSQNAILHLSGIYVRPAREGITGFDAPGEVKGICFFRAEDNNEYLIVVANGKVYSVDQNTYACTELFDTGSTSFNAYFAVAGGKCYVANGGTPCKVESSVGGLVCYRIGISPPITGNAVAAAGGTLADGTYTVYWSYARYDGVSDLLYSQPFLIGTVTLGGANHSISLTNLDNSLDPQVGDKVVWITEPSGTANYWYAHTGDNTTTSLTISNNSTKKSNVISSVYADQNNLPQNFNYIIFSRNRLYGSYENKIYYSKKNSINDFDYERYEDDAYIIFPYTVRGVIGYNGDVFINTESGIYKQPYGEPSYEYQTITNGEYWKYFDTVKEYGGKLYGLTNFGLKIFVSDDTGARFYQVDMIDPIRKEVDMVYTSSLNVTAEIFRRSIEIGFSTVTISRVVYALSFNDNRYGETCNNIRLELNLNNVQFLPNDQCIAPWEYHFSGFDYSTVNSNGTPYYLQSSLTKPVLYRESKLSGKDTNVYDENCTLLATKNIKVVVRLKVFYSGDEMLVRFLDGGAKFGTYHDFDVKVINYDGSYEDSIVLSSASSGTSFWDVSEWDVAQWSEETMGVKHFLFKNNLIGRNLYIYISYEGGEASWYITDINVNAKLSKNRFSYAY